MKKVGVILCGSGYKDGSEIRESVATLWALSQHPVEVKIFAPNLQQVDVVNCLTNQPAPNEKRNMLVEAARIARGQISDLKTAKAEELDALILPGGFGAAKNLCTFAFKGSKGTVLPELETLLHKMHQQKKPIGAICIAPAIIALAFANKNFELSVGPTSEAAHEIEKCGHKHIQTDVSQCHVDTHNKIVTSAAYMVDSAPLHKIFEGIKALVDETLKLTQGLKDD